MFRSGAQRWTTRQRVLKVLQFGLIHALIGIPIGVALALSVGGAYFMSVYLRSYALTGSANEATLESTRAHTAYNALIIARGCHRRGRRRRRLTPSPSLA